MAVACPKRPFASKRDAKRFLKAHRQPRFGSRHVYECRSCPAGTWHLTSQTAGTRWTIKQAA